MPTIRAKTMRRGTILTSRDLAKNRGELLPLAVANCLAKRKTIKAITATKPNPTPKTIMLVVVIEVIVLVITVVIISFYSLTKFTLAVLPIVHYEMRFVNYIL